MPAGAGTARAKAAGNQAFLGEGFILLEQTSGREGGDGGEADPRGLHPITGSIRGTRAPPGRAANAALTVLHGQLIPWHGAQHGAALKGAGEAFASE